jgi:hypothetical protein
LGEARHAIEALEGGGVRATYEIDDRWLSEILDHMKEDNISSEYVNARLRGDGSVHTPIEALGQRRLFFHLLKKGYFKINDTLRVKDPDGLIRLIKGAMEYAPVIYMNSEVYNLMFEMSNKIIETIESSDVKSQPKKLPFDQFWFTTQHVMGKDIGIDGVLFINVHHDQPLRDLSQDIRSLRFSFENQKIFYNWVDQPITDSLAILLEEKIVAVEKKLLPRQIRKAAKKVGLPCEEYVRVITLRSLERGSSVNGSGSTREYHHRWLVRGHPRNQYFASDGHHEIIWIDPYAKGPEGAPFIETVRNVVR